MLSFAEYPDNAPIRTGSRRRANLVTPLQAARDVATRFLRTPGEVRVLRDALLNGDVETKRPPIPKEVVSKILNLAEFWCCVQKAAYSEFLAQGLDLQLFTLGPVRGTPHALEFSAELYEQLIERSSAATPGDAGTFGEVQLKHRSGHRKAMGTQLVFANFPTAAWIRQERIFDRQDHFMAHFEEGNRLEFRVQACHWPARFLYVRNACLRLHYEPSL